MPDRIEGIYHSVLKFLTPLSTEKTLEEIVSEAVKLTSTKWGSIYLNEGGKLVKVYSTAPKKSIASPRKKGYTYKAHETGKAITISDVEKQPDHPMFGVAKFIIHMPLLYNNEPYGVMNLISNKNLKRPNRSSRELLLFGTMASLAIRKAQLYNEKKEALARRDLFLNIASHELKTPLTSIYVYSELLKRKFEKTAGPEGKWSRRLYRETIRLTSLISELLSVDLAKSGALKYFMKKCSLKEIVKRAVSDMQLVYPDHNFIVKTKDENYPFNVNGDYDKLLQVILNLLSNAAKFSPTQSAIFINLNKKGPDVSFSVQDYGSGIPKESLSKIFDIFYKTDTTREGMGIGLYLVRKIVEKHHGAIKVKSEPNRGTKVEISFLEAK